MEEKKEHEEKEHKTEHHTKKRKKSNTWMYVSVILVILLAVSGYYNLAGGNSGGLTAEQAGNKVVGFINDNFVPPGEEAEIVSTSEINGMYLIEASFQGQTVPLYSTKDGNLFFSGQYAIDISEFEAQMATEDLTGGASSVEAVKADVPNVKMFVMTFCPYGQQAENGLGPAVEVLGDSVEFEPHFVIYSDYATRMGAEWNQFCWDEEEQYCSMHGIGELNEGVRQLCVWMEEPAKWWDYVEGINAECDYTNVDECWEDVAEEVGIDVSEIQTCFDEKGELLLKKEALLNGQYGVQGSPTVFINDAEYNGGRAPENFKQAICNSFNEAPGECETELSTTGAAATGDCG